MAEKIPYTCQEPATLLFSSITQKSAPRTVQNAEPKFSGTFGIGQRDFDALLPIMVQAITSECGTFSGNPSDYYLACMSGRMAAQRIRQKAELDAQGKSQDEAFKIREKAEKRASVYETYPGILQGSSKFDIELAHLSGGKIVDIKEPHQIAQAGKDMFYSGAIVVPRVAIQGFRRKTLDAKDGCTGFLQNCLFIRKGPKIDLGGGGPNNQDVFGGFQNYSDYDPLANAPGNNGGGNENWGGQQNNQNGQQQNWNNGGQQQDPNAGQGFQNGQQQNNGGGFQQDPNAGQQQNNNQGGYQPQGGYNPQNGQQQNNGGGNSMW